MSVVGEITLPCGRECLLEPVVAWTGTQCFCLIEVLIWPSSDLCVSWPVFEVFWVRQPGGGFNGLCTWTVYPISSCAIEPRGKRNKSSWAGGKIRHNWTRGCVFWPGAVLRALQQESEAVGQRDTRPLTRRLQSQVERCLGQHLNPFFHGCQFWNQQRPLKTEVYTVDKDGGPRRRPSPCSAPWVIPIKK